MQFGEMFRKSRKSSDIYLREIAEIANVSVSFLAEVERREKLPPKRKTIVRMLRAIGITKSNPEYNRMIECAKNDIVSHYVSKFLEG